MATICDICGTKAVERVIIDSTDERFDLCLKHVNQFLKMISAQPPEDDCSGLVLNKDGTPRKRMGRPPKVQTDVTEDDAVGL